MLPEFSLEESPFFKYFESLNPIRDIVSSFLFRSEERKIHKSYFTHDRAKEINVCLTVFAATDCIRRGGYRGCLQNAKQMDGLHCPYRKLSYAAQHLR